MDNARVLYYARLQCGELVRSPTTWAAYLAGIGYDHRAYCTVPTDVEVVRKECDVRGSGGKRSTLWSITAVRHARMP